jgi:RNA polymerase sigma factor (sigma-70 family)
MSKRSAIILSAAPVLGAASTAMAIGKRKPVNRHSGPGVGQMGALIGEERSEYRSTQAEDDALKANDSPTLSRGASSQEQSIADPSSQHPRPGSPRASHRGSAREFQMNAFACRPVSGAARSSPAAGPQAPGGVPRQAAPANGIDVAEANARFAAVVMPHLDDAFAVARWLTGTRADAEDVVQDTCLRAFRGIGGFAGGNARAWVLTIVRHAAYSWLRRNRSAALIMVEDLEAVERVHADPADPQHATPETELIAKADAARLEAAIAALPAPFKETLVLRDIRGLGYREIALATEAPIGTVMSRLARARRRVSASLQLGIAGL